jgi:ATP:cob(I)alamin adenosyltransferase
MSITTKKGDSGNTSLFGGKRVGKNTMRIECNGLIDEANTRIGMLMVEMEEEHPWREPLRCIQRDLMLMMSHIATPADCPKENKKLHPEKGVQRCEAWIQKLNKSLDKEKLAFVLPGGTRIAASCHFVRTAIRTAERQLVSLHNDIPLPDYILKYFNRLSDLFYLLAIAELTERNVKPERFMLFPSQKLK